MTPELKKVLTEAKMPKFDSQTADLELCRAFDKAKMRISEAIDPSPLRRSHWLSEATDAEVWLKCDNLTPNGSFKVRGAVNAIATLLEHKGHFTPKPDSPNAGEHSPESGISAAVPPIKVCAASAGNHAQGVAYAAKRLGCEAHIFLPKRTPLVKRNATARLGAKVYLVGDVLEEAFEAALEFSQKENAHFLHAFNDFDVIVGQGTCLTESFMQFHLATGRSQAEIDYFLCSVGGGGLAAGCGLAMKLYGAGKVWGVEQEIFDSAKQSLQNRQQSRISHEVCPTLADGIAVQLIGNVNFEIMQQTVDRIVTVSDAEIAAAMLAICERERLVVEGAGAAAVAALLKYAKTFAGKCIVVCLSGGNIDPQLLMRVISRGLGVTGRVLRLSVRLGDRPGQLNRLLRCVAELDANVLEVHHDRTYTQVMVGEVEVDLALETRDNEHQYEILQALQEGEFVFRTVAN